MRIDRSPLSLLLIAAASCAIVSCAPSADEDPLAQEAPEVVFASAPRIAFKSEGNAVVSYREVTERGNNSRARLWVGSTSFELGQTQPAADPRTNFPNESHALGADASDTVLSIHASGLYDSATGSQPGFRACRLTKDLPSWECSQLLVGGEQKTAIAMSELGIALALMTVNPSASSDHHDLQSVAHTGTRWAAPQTVAQTFPFSTNGSDPAVVYGAGLAGYAMYLGPDKRLLAQRYDGVFDRWEPALVLAEAFGDRPAGNARLVLHYKAPNAAAMALWLTPEPNSEPRIRVARYANNGWNLIPREVPGSNCASAMDAAMDAGGDVLVVWRCDEGSNSGHVFASRYAGGAWSTTPEEIGVGAASNAPIKLAVDARGDGVALWRAESELFVANYSMGTGWSSAQSIGAITEGQFRNDFVVALDDLGHGLAAWVRNSGTVASEGTRIAQLEVGPFAFSVTVPRYAFGGDAVPVTFRRGSASTTSNVFFQGTVIGSLVAQQYLFAVNQTELTVDLPTSAVSSFLGGTTTTTYNGVRYTRPITLMPEPTDVSVQVTPPSVVSGEQATLDLQVAPTYPIALDLQLESSNAIASVPAQVTTGMTTSAATVRIATTAMIATAQMATFTARFRNRTGTGSLQVFPANQGQPALTVSLVTGQGTVSSSPAGITNCGVICTAAFPIGTIVTLTPVPAAGFRFYAWEGHPDCGDGVVSMFTPRTCLAVFLPVLPPYADGMLWTLLGAPLTGDNFVNPSPALALDGPHPIVAYVNKDTTIAAAQLFVRQRQGGIFAPLGGGALNVDTAQSASEPAMVTTSTGSPYVAWIEGTGAQQNLYVKRYTFVSGVFPVWASVGAANTPLNYVAGSQASSPSIALDTELRPMVAWVENGAVKFKRFDGTTWVQAQGGEGPASAAADRVRVSSFGGGVPVIAWMQGSGAGRALKVVRDFAFTALGTQVNAASFSLTSEFGVLGGINPAVSWAEVLVANSQLNVTIRSRRWNNLDWVDAAPNQVVNLNPNILISIAMPRNALTVSHSFANTVGDVSQLSVFSINTLGNWGPITSPLVGTRATNVGPTPVELVSAESPVVVIVSRDALGRHMWSAHRYYRP